MDGRAPTERERRRTELYGFDLRDGDRARRLVLRVPPPGSARHAAALARQVPLLRVLAAHGLPVPLLRFGGADARWFGTPYTVVDRMPGTTLGDVLADPVARPPADRSALYDQAVDTLAALHAVDVARELPGWGEVLPGTGLARHDVRPRRLGCGLPPRSGVHPVAGGPRGAVRVGRRRRRAPRLVARAVRAPPRRAHRVLTGAGEVLVVPAGLPHKFAVVGPGTYEAVHIHENDRFVTEWLE